MNQKSHIIGIAGGSASGKTFLLEYIRRIFTEAEACVISQDNYYLPAYLQQKDENGHINFDLPEGIDHQRFVADIGTLSQQKTVTLIEYKFNQQGVKGKEITLKPAPVIIVEGLFIFHFSAIKKLLDHKIFIEAPEEIRLARRMERDKNERGVSEEMILYQWQNHVKPGYEKYLLPYREEADRIINNDSEVFKEAFEGVKGYIEGILNG